MEVKLWGVADETSLSPKGWQICPDRETHARSRQEAASQQVQSFQNRGAGATLCWCPGFSDQEKSCREVDGVSMFGS